MKQRIISLIITFALIIISCAEEEEKLELFSPDAFAFILDDGWELNASVNVRGFKQKEENDKYYYSVIYLVHMITPTDTILNIDFGKLEKTSSEELLDLTIESQIDVNSEFETGNYELILFAEDQLNTNKDTIHIPFSLTAE